MRINKKQADHNPNRAWSIGCHCSPTPLVFLQPNLFIPSFTDWLSEWLTNRPSYCLTRPGQYMYMQFFTSVLLVWSCHHFYSQLGGSSLKLDCQDQRAEDESISIKLKTPPSLLKTAANGKIAQCLWLRAWHCISAFRQTDRERQEAGRARAEMWSGDLFYGTETSVKRCKYVYICLSL